MSGISSGLRIAFGKWDRLKNVYTLSQNLLTVSRTKYMEQSCPPSEMYRGDQYSFGIVPPKNRLYERQPYNIAGLRHFGAVNIPARRTKERFPVDVSCCLEVDVTGKTEVDVSLGENMEEISVEAEWHDKSAVNESSENFMLISSRNNKIVVTENANLEGFLPPEKLNIQIPERFCSVSIHTWEGNVSLAGTSEGSVHISTDRGHVKIGKIKGESTQISTNGGTVTAKRIFSSLSVNSGGGDVVIGQVLGNNTKIDTQGNGNFSVDSLYGQRFWVSCNKFSANSINSNQAKISSQGDVSIYGLEGNCEIDSKNGPIEIQLCQKAEQVSVASGSNPVTVFCPPNLEVKFDVKLCATLESNLGENATEGQWKEAGERVCEVEVCCPNSEIILRRRSWMEAMEIKMSKLG